MCPQTDMDLLEFNCTQFSLDPMVCIKIQLFIKKITFFKVNMHAISKTTEEDPNPSPNKVPHLKGMHKAAETRGVYK